MPLQVVYVRVFADARLGPLAGNTSPVIKLVRPLPPAALQALAAELNQDVTTLIEELVDGRLRLHFNTPSHAVPLSGHGAMAAAAAIAHGGNRLEQAAFLTPGADVAVQRNSVSRYTLTLPVATASTKALPKGLGERICQALLPPKVAHSAVQCVFSPALGMLLLDVSDTMSSAELQHMVPDTAQLKAAGSYEQLNSVVVTCWNAGGATNGHAGLEDCTVTARVFQPWVGVPEALPTGVPYSAVAPHFASKHGTTTLRVLHAHPRRPGIIDCEVLEPQGLVKIGGNVHVTLEGKLLL